MLSEIPSKSDKEILLAIPKVDKQASRLGLYEDLDINPAAAVAIQ